MNKDVRRFRQQYRSQKSSILEKKVCNNIDVSPKEAVFAMIDMERLGLAT